MVDVPFDRPDDEPDRPREPDRPADPPDRRPPWEEPGGVIERVISASGWRDAPASRQLPRPLRDVPDEVAAAGGPAGYVARADRGERDATERVREVGLRIDRPEAHDRYADDPIPQNDYAEALRARPALDGPPRRDQVEQGGLGDCGVMAAMGAVAAHRPEAIVRCVRDAADGGYAMELHHPEWRGDVCEPTGDTVRMAVPSEVPVFDHQPDRPAFAQAPEGAWPAALEKALAGYDQAWTPEQRADWESRWEQIKAVRNAEREAKGVEPLPDGPSPTGYARLNQGTNAWDRAEILTQVTGEAAVVRRFPDSDDALAAELEVQLADRKPVLAGSRPVDKVAGEARLPHGLYPSHAYEVTAVQDGKVHLHNPWNHRHPDPLAVAEFRECFSRPDHEGRKHGIYTTLR